MYRKVIILIILFAAFFFCGSFYKIEDPVFINTDFSFFSVDLTKMYEVKVLQEENFYTPAKKGYLYGPSIIKNDDIYNLWFSSPGNNSTEWDYITYFNGEMDNWSDRQIVLKPTSGSLDKCSVCDPGVIYFNGYYYLAYTSTNDAIRDGMNNQAFVARSKNPDGPFEKWNGEGWGGNPYPIITYNGNPDNWGIGEVSFVIFENELYIYYTLITDESMVTCLSFADLSEDWPSTIKEYGVVNARNYSDSLDVAYDDNLKMFIGVAVGNRMDKNSEIVFYTSENGKNFEMKASLKIDDYSHNIGIEKDYQGHLNTEQSFMLGYAYGSEWGKWSTKLLRVIMRQY